MPPAVRVAHKRLLREAYAPWWLIYPERGAIWGYPLPWDRPTAIATARDGRIIIGSTGIVSVVEVVPASAAFQAYVPPGQMPAVERRKRPVHVLLNGVVRDRLTLGDGDQIAVGETILWFMDLTAFADDWLMRPAQLGFGPHDRSPIPKVWVERIGPFLTDGDLERQEHGVGSISVRTTTETLLGVDDGRGHRLYPAFQFDSETAQPYEVLQTVVPLFRAARIDDFSSASWFKSPRSLLDAMTPAEWMAAHRDDDTLVEAVHRALAHMGR